MNVFGLCHRFKIMRKVALFHFPTELRNIKVIFSLRAPLSVLSCTENQFSFSPALVWGLMGQIYATYSILTFGFTIGIPSHLVKVIYGS